MLHYDATAAIWNNYPGSSRYSTLFSDNRDSSLFFLYLDAQWRPCFFLIIIIYTNWMWNSNEWNIYETRFIVVSYHRDDR